MRFILQIILAVLCGILIARIGVELNIFISALAMPMTFIRFPIVWDIFVVQFGAFGILALLSGFIITRLFDASLLISVILVLLVYLIAIQFPFLYPIYWLNIVVIGLCLFVGYSIARFLIERKHRMMVK